jgi:hypothetical protein
MACSLDDIKRWFKEGKRVKATHMIVVCDTFDYEDYPVYVARGQNVRDIESAHTGNMQHVMEVYNLSLPMEQQLNEVRSFNY